MKIFRKTILEIRILGINFYIPFIVLCLTFLLSSLFSNYSNGLSLIINIFQIAIPFFCSWWMIFLLHEILEIDSGELILTFKANKLLIGSFLCIKYFIIFLFPSLITIALSFKLFFGLFNIGFLLQITAQCLFISSLCFLLMSLLKNISWTIFILVSYIIFSFYNNFKIYVIPRTLIIITEFLSLNKVNFIILECLLYSFVYFIIGQIIFNETANKSRNSKFFT